MTRKIVAALVCLVFASCASQRVLVNTKPAGARIRVDGKEIGRSPATFEDGGAIGKTYVIEAEADGHDKAVVHTKQEWSSTCTLDLVLGLFIWPALLGLFGCQQIPSGMLSLDLAPKAPEPTTVPASYVAPAASAETGCQSDRDCKSGRRCNLTSAACE
jgi:hypothetical protein